MGIDIGNEASAFIEVQVARSGTSDPKFEVNEEHQLSICYPDQNKMQYSQDCMIRHVFLCTLPKL